MAADYNLRRELVERLRDPDTRAALLAALLGEGGKTALKPAEALKVLDYITEALEADRPPQELPEDTDMSQYTDARLRAMLAELEAGPDG